MLGTKVTAMGAVVAYAVGNRFQGATLPGFGARVVNLMFAPDLGHALQSACPR